MSAIALLANHLQEIAPPEPPTDGLCCVTGVVGPSIARKYAVKPSFTNLDLLRAPESDRVGVAAWRVLTDHTLRQSSWICDAGGFRRIDRLVARELVLTTRPDAPWCGYITTSYKKHGALRAPVNAAGSYRWLFEMDVVDAREPHDWWEIIRDARTAGIPRPVIETLDCSVYLMSKHFALWRDFERWARDKWQSPLYRLLTYLLPSEEELRATKQD